MTPLYLKHMSQMGEMPDLAESQTSLKQVAKSHPGYCLKFIDTRSTQHQPLYLRSSAERWASHSFNPTYTEQARHMGTIFISLAWTDVQTARDILQMETEALLKQSLIQR